LAEQQNTESILNNVAAGLDHFDPFQGFVDDGETLNLRYGFRLGNINFLVNEFSMCEVVKKPTIYSIPNTPSWIKGLINLRGILVPVIDIKKRIDQEDKDNKNDTLLVIDKGERAFATFIDSLPDSINLDDSDFTKTTAPEAIPEILKKHVTEAFEFKQDIWLEIDYDTFIKNLTKDYSDYQTDE
jgi:purine-binding chemotaxis protein CheW